MTTRQARPADCDRIVDLRLKNAAYHASLLPSVTVHDSAKAYFTAHTQKCIEEERSVIIVGFFGEKLMAYGIGELNDPHPVLDFGTLATIDDIFVSPAFERQGHGEAIVQELNTWFKLNGANRVDLNVYTSNPKGSAFWNKLGFEVMFRRLYKEG